MFIGFPWTWQVHLWHTVVQKLWWRQFRMNLYDQMMEDFDPRDEVPNAELIEEAPPVDEAVALAPQVPREPTLGERENHVTTGHAAFAPWCEYCIAGRGSAKLLGICV